ncbi:MAG: response regulator [Bacteroidales bacterium]|jgi:CheY-like chemotaxis protein
MVKETDTSHNETMNGPAGKFFEEGIKKIMPLSYVALSAPIIAILLLMFDLKLPAGIIIILSAALEIYILNKAVSQLNAARNSINDISHSSEKKDDVITDFSHRIREPLNNLVIITDMLMESGLQKKQRELLDTFIASTNNMVTIVNELTMQSAGNLSLESRKQIRFNLLSTIQNTLELYSLKDNANIDFIMNKKEQADFECFGDPIIIKQIFLNIFNSIENEFSERTTKVTLNLKKEKVTDTEIIAGLRIQADRKIDLINEKDLMKSLAARLITSCKGTFSQESGQNVTVLNISLPFTSVAHEPRQHLASARMEELILKEKTHKELKDIRLLLVEDNMINQKITHLTLQPLVHSIDTASNGKEALDKFGTANYDLILMDIQMPVMSGLIAAEKIRALEATTSTHIPIIAITANAMLGDKEKCISAGIDDYISKPFQPSALIDKIKKFI